MEQGTFTSGQPNIVEERIAQLKEEQKAFEQQFDQISYAPQKPIYEISNRLHRPHYVFERTGVLDPAVRQRIKSYDSVQGFKSTGLPYDSPPDLLNYATAIANRINAGLTPTSDDVWLMKNQALNIEPIVKNKLLQHGMSIDSINSIVNINHEESDINNVYVSKYNTNNISFVDKESFSVGNGIGKETKIGEERSNEFEKQKLEKEAIKIPEIYEDLQSYLKNDGILSDQEINVAQKQNEKNKLEVSRYVLQVPENLEHIKAPLIELFKVQEVIDAISNKNSDRATFSALVSSELGDKAGTINNEIVNYLQYLHTQVKDIPVKPNVEEQFTVPQELINKVINSAEISKRSEQQSSRNDNIINGLNAPIQIVLQIDGGFLQNFIANYKSNTEAFEKFIEIIKKQSLENENGLIHKDQNNNSYREETHNTETNRNIVMPKGSSDKYISINDSDRNIVENYFLNELSAKDRAHVEERIKTDPIFKSYFENEQLEIQKEKYILGGLNETEKKLFQKKMDNDPDLLKEIKKMEHNRDMSYLAYRYYGIAPEEFGAKLTVQERSTVDKLSKTDNYLAFHLATTKVLSNRLQKPENLDLNKTSTVKKMILM